MPVVTKLSITFTLYGLWYCLHERGTLVYEKRKTKMKPSCTRNIYLNAIFYNLPLDLPMKRVKEDIYSTNLIQPFEVSSNLLIMFLNLIVIFSLKLLCYPTIFPIFK